jgi:peroxiredoxin Q/BCP
MSEMPKVGDPAPDFTAKDQNGNDVTLSKLKGKRVVLFFYPKASTPG